MNLLEAYDNRNDWDLMYPRNFLSLGTLIAHLNMWYSGYKITKKGDSTLIIKLKRGAVVRTGLLSNILSVEKSLKSNYMDFDIKWTGREIKIYAYSFLETLRSDQHALKHTNKVCQVNK